MKKSITPRRVLRRCCAVAVIGTALLHVDADSGVEPSAAPKTIVAVRVSSPPLIDGRLDDPVWQQAQPITGSTQREPDPGKPATEQTLVYCLYDEGKIYFGFRCLDSEPEKIVRRLTRRDRDSESDWVELILDTYNDHRTGYAFMTNPAGVQVDKYAFKDREWPDWNWDGVWECQARIDGEGWTAEVAIPFSILRFSPDPEQTWGVNFRRTIARKAEDDYWVPVSKDDQWFRISKLGTLVGLKHIRHGQHLELLPYAAGSWEKTTGLNDKGVGDVGMDLKYGLTSNLTADFTLNPDFAQVEADAYQINLTRFELYISEKRPFFLEAGKTFATPIELFYSRRIGSESDIVTGAKLTGKLGGYTLGFIDAYTGDWNSLGLREKENTPEANYAVFRLKKDVFRNSTMGLLVANKDGVKDHSRVAGIDTRLVYADLYYLNAQVARSWNSGLKVENRWDDSALKLAAGRYGYFFTVEYKLERFGNEFEINETGFYQHDLHAGRKKTGIWYHIQPRLEKYGIRNIRYAQWFGIDRDSNEPKGSRDSHSYLEIGFLNQMGLEAVWKSYDRVEPDISYDGRRYAISFWTDWRKRIEGWFSLGTETYYHWDKKYVGTVREGSLWGRIQPQDNTRMELEVRNSRIYDPDDRLDEQHWTGSSRFTYQFTRDVFWRNFLQFRRRWDAQADRRDKAWLVDTSLGYTFRPGSTCYLVYNQSWDQSGGRLRTTNRAIIAKVSYWQGL